MQYPFWFLRLWSCTLCIGITIDDMLSGSRPLVDLYRYLIGGYTESGLDTNTLTVDRLPGATDFHVGQVKSTWQLPCRATGIPCHTIWLMLGSLIN